MPTDAETHSLLPVVLGDWFHYPRDNANRLLVELFNMLPKTILGIYGNHDCTETELGEDDTLSLLVSSGCLRLLNNDDYWQGEINGRSVIIGGTPWGRRLPGKFNPGNAQGEKDHLVFWIAHHDIHFQGYEEGGRFYPYEIPGIDVVINGHIHRSLKEIVAGKTTWLNPGNIARVIRSDACKDRIPSVLRIDIDHDGWNAKVVQLSFKPFEEVFYEDLASEEVSMDYSLFVRGLEGLQSFKTQGGAGLLKFLDEIVSQFDDRVAKVIKQLAREVCKDAE